MSNISQDKIDFRTTVLCLKRQNPSWNAPEIATFLQRSENPPSLSRESLRKKISIILKRGTVNDNPRSGRPITVATTKFRNKLRSCLILKNCASQRNAKSILNRKGFKCSLGTVIKTCKKLKLKWNKKRKALKLNENHKIKRVLCAKHLRKKFGTNQK